MKLFPLLDKCLYHILKTNPTSDQSSFNYTKKDFADVAYTEEQWEALVKRDFTDKGKHNDISWKEYYVYLSRFVKYPNETEIPFKYQIYMAAILGLEKYILFELGDLSNNFDLTDNAIPAESKTFLRGLLATAILFRQTHLVSALLSQDNFYLMYSSQLDSWLNSLLNNTKYINLCLDQSSGISVPQLFRKATPLDKLNQKNKSDFLKFINPEYNDGATAKLKSILVDAKVSIRNKSKKPLPELPAKVIQTVFEKWLATSPRDITNAAKVSKMWNEVSKGTVVWRKVCEKRGIPILETGEFIRDPKKTVIQNVLTNFQVTQGYPTCLLRALGGFDRAAQLPMLDDQAFRGQSIGDHIDYINVYGRLGLNDSPFMTNSIMRGTNYVGVKYLAFQGIYDPQVSPAQIRDYYRLTDVKRENCPNKDFYDGMMPFTLTLYPRHYSAEKKPWFSNFNDAVCQLHPNFSDFDARLLKSFREKKVGSVSQFGLFALLIEHETKREHDELMGSFFNTELRLK